MKSNLAASAAALVLLAGLSSNNVYALRSDLARKVAAEPSTSVVESVTTARHELSANVEDEEFDEDDEENGAIVRCRFCGAAVAATADYVGLHDTSKAVASKRERVLGTDGALHTFVNPSRVEMDLAGFKRSFGVESELFTKKASFFDAYSWRDVRCASCKRHLGWKFHHDDLQKCINARTVDSIEARARAQRQLDGAAGEKQRRAQIVEQTFAPNVCVLANFGWWSYEVCYKKEVRQYHEEQDGSRSSDWSMGVFVPQEQAADAPDMGSDVVQYFAGGQYCDENGEQRNSRVTYTCCKSKPAEISIGTIVEPTLCSYVINVCVPELCAKSEDAKVLESALEAQRHAEACEREMEEAAAALATGDRHEDESSVKSPPISFTALRWSTVISEASSELDWARSMQFKA